ncbi:DEAD/DEAH box helicase family protein [Candidatus Saccharibacteria bacterium]|nr:DEAD/DEAH box helicase family protein [Candidatus Saccharibacteria bacterium]
MVLRNYQQEVLVVLNNYLAELAKAKIGYDAVKQTNPEFANQIDYPEMAWKNIGRTDFNSVRNGLEEPIANVWLKVPTGGGKTLLACHGISAISEQFLNKQTGLVVWVVPSTQIYRQTLANLQNKQHPYRQTLDIASAGKVLIVEKTDKFTLDDVATHLVILVVMMQSTGRVTKETLKFYRDSTGYITFFPAEDAYKDHDELITKYPNLDYFEPDWGIGGKVVKTSLGNVLRVSNPIVIVDEGQRAMSSLARQTLLGFNPSFMLELSATPPQDVNCLVSISGKALNDEEMIKLDLNVTNKYSTNWQQTVRASKDKRDEIEKEAVSYQQNTGKYIRPIMLVQVERTGKDQIDENYIHAEHVKEYLHKKLGVPLREIAIKSSEKDDIEGIDLLADTSPIRYIITKQALQEGWDCSFAYVLCVLGASKSATSLTQLVGRILRQPYAQKTGNTALDESFVFAYQQNTQELVGSIKKNLESEGLGDILNQLRFNNSKADNPEMLDEVTANVRPKFTESVENLYLPLFAVKDKGKWREYNYKRDLLTKIDFSDINLSALNKIVLADKEKDDEIYAVGYGDKKDLRAVQVGELTYDSDLDESEFTRRILDIIPNPWQAFEIIEKTQRIFLKTYSKEIVAGNRAYILEVIRQLARSELDRLSKDAFLNMIEKGVIKFYLLKKSSNKIGQSITFRDKILNKISGEPLQQSLFDKVPYNANDFEKNVMWYMDEHNDLLWWYRNLAKRQYAIKGWKDQNVYPDFVAAKGTNNTVNKIFVLETKGDQLIGNIDTLYKQQLFELCNKYAKEIDAGEFFGQEKEIKFELVNQSTWKNQLNSLFNL